MKANSPTRLADEATSADLHHIIGELDDETVMAILDLNPTLADVERASLWANGQIDLSVDKRPEGKITRIVDILTTDDEDNPSSAH